MTDKDFKYLLLVIDLRTGITQVVSFINFNHRVLKLYHISSHLLGLDNDTNKVRLYISKIPRMTLKQCNVARELLVDTLKNNNDYLIINYLV